MEFVKKLLESVEYKNRLRKLKEMEQDRVYCRHDLDHFLHVAPIPCFCLWNRDWSWIRNSSTSVPCSTIWDAWRNTGLESPMQRLLRPLQGRFCAFWVTMRRKRGRSAMPFPITVEG